MKKIYISSTFNDLKEHRAAVTQALRKMGYTIHCMEDYVATDERTDERCKKDVEKCDFYVGILARRYGWIPPGQKGQKRSITEIEYRQARSQHPETKCLMFVLDDDAKWPKKWIDAAGDDAAKLRAFKKAIARNSAFPFRGLDDLVREVMAAVHTEDAKQWSLALKKEFDGLFAACHVTPMSAPEDLQNNFKLYLNTSGKDAIIQVLQTAIQQASGTKLVKIDLARNGGWWSTRLHLLAGLLADYTDVEKLAFFQDGKYVGTCGPVETRRALAVAFPNIERAFSAALPDKREFDPRSDIGGIVTRFTATLDASGGEQELKRDVREHIVRNFRGFNDDRLPRNTGRDDFERQRELLGKSGAFVALEHEDGDVAIVNRVEFACRVAELAVARI